MTLNGGYCHVFEAGIVYRSLQTLCRVLNIHAGFGTEGWVSLLLPHSFLFKSFESNVCDANKDTSKNTSLAFFNGRNVPFWWFHCVSLLYLNSTECCVSSPFRFFWWVWQRYALRDFLECWLFDLVPSHISRCCLCTSITAAGIIAHVWLGSIEIDWRMFVLFSFCASGHAAPFSTVHSTPPGLISLFSSIFRLLITL